MGGESRAWYYLATRIAAVVVVGLALGFVIGHPVAGVALALAVALGWQLYQLFVLDWWLRHRSISDPPDAGGLWGDTVAQIVRLHRRKRFHKQEWLRLLREVRRSTSALPDGVVALDAQHEIQWFNAKAGALLGLDRKRDLGIRVENLLRQPEFVAYVRSGHYAAPVVVQPKGTEEQYLSLHIVPYGEGQRLLLVRDVTRETRLETLRKDFVANASHELRSPLTVLSGYLETIAQDDGLDPALRAPVDEMRRQADRMTTIIQDLLELSRLEADEAEVIGEPIDVAALVAMLRKDVLARPRHPAEVRVEIESTAQLVGAVADVQSAFSNLVDNAAKYTPPEGTVTIRWWTDDVGAHFSVRDTGIGIAAEHLPRLTERFYRVDAGRSRETGGSGLGLAIVKHVLQRHGGALSIDSVEGTGSTFTCHFPLRRIVNERS